MFDYPGRDWPSADCERIEGLAALCPRLLEARDGPARISYRGDLNSKHFGQWASVALAWSQFAPVTIVAEELADDAGEKLEALDLVASMEAWDRLRCEQRLGRDRAARVMEAALRALLARPG